MADVRLHSSILFWESILIKELFLSVLKGLWLLDELSIDPSTSPFQALRLHGTLFEDRLRRVERSLVISEHRRHLRLSLFPFLIIYHAFLDPSAHGLFVGLVVTHCQIQVVCLGNYKGLFGVRELEILMQGRLTIEYEGVRFFSAN